MITNVLPPFYGSQCIDYSVFELILYYVSWQIHNFSLLGGGQLPHVPLASYVPVNLLLVNQSFYPSDAVLCINIDD